MTLIMQKNMLAGTPQKFILIDAYFQITYVKYTWQFLKQS